MTQMEAVLKMVAAGVIEIRSDGTVWKLRNLGRWSTVGTPLRAPRRVESVAKNGYLLVKVCMDGRQFTVWAHRLIWTVLRGQIPEGLQINHKDGNPKNNHPDNLELSTGAQNMLHSYRVLGRKLPKSIPTPILAEVAPQAKQLRAEGLTLAQIAKRLGISQTTAFRATRAS